MASLEKRSSRSIVRLPKIFSWLLPSSEPSNEYPPAPDGSVIYVIGDIHGRADLLDALGAQINSDREKERPDHSLEIYLGDYIDRGPSSSRVIDWLITRKENREAVFLRGNHEYLLEEFLSGESSFKDWAHLGGFETLISYGMDHLLRDDLPADDAIRGEFAERFPVAHRQFVDGLVTSADCGAYFFVHAGVRPGVPLDEQAERDCLWVRDDFLDYEGDFGRIVVHGHSPAPKPEFLRNRINLDTAAYATGRLSCLKISAVGAHLLGSSN